MAFSKDRTTLLVAKSDRDKLEEIRVALQAESDFRVTLGYVFKTLVNKEYDELFKDRK